MVGDDSNDRTTSDAGGSTTSDANDPTTIRSLAVSPEDVVDAFVYTRENPGTAVLRVTPPFHGRMRARLHVYHGEDAAVTDAVRLDPADLLPDDVVASYPSVEERLGAERGTGAERSLPADDPERAREARAAAVDGWRERAREAILDDVVVETSDGQHAIDLKRLG